MLCIAGPEEDLLHALHDRFAARPVQVAADLGAMAAVLRLLVGGPAHLYRAKDLVDLYRAVRRLGPAGVEVPLIVSRSGDVLRKVIRSADRNDFLKKPNLQ